MNSCVREVATAFASLPPVIEMPDATAVADHRALELLAAPNAAQDYFEFSELEVTQYLSLGNVYIEKVRGITPYSRSMGRATYPVKELGLLKPEYVRIKPGATRLDDRFEVWIEGRMRRSLPRADVIHLRTPDLVNDFYGLPPPAQLAAEGIIDSSMNSMHVALYRNAGIPFGVLTVNRKRTASEMDEIKSRFRQALGRVQQWFELLVINAEEAKYEAMALGPKDMEQVNTRDVVETRICMVYGVPPIIVGANVGLKNNRYSNFSQAQASLYGETVIPLSKRIAAALNRELVVEFATQATAKAALRFEVKQVRALREVELAALETASAVYASGLMSDHDALRAAGFPAPQGEPRYRSDPPGKDAEPDKPAETGPDGEGEGEEEEEVGPRPLRRLA